MCRWHKIAAKEAATNPQTGEFNVGQYAVALTAMGLLRVEQKKWKLDALFEIDGFNPREVLEKDAMQAFEQSGLKKPLSDAQRDLSICVAHMRHALEKTAAAFDLSPEALNIKDRITKEGYKVTCCAAPNPRENGPFLDAAVVYLAKGYDDEAERDYASDILELISYEELEALKSDPTVAENDRAHIPHLEAVRSATEYFLAQPEMMDVLQHAFANTVAVIFETAEDDLKMGRGLEGPSDCIMCEGVKGRKPKAPTQG
jgi:hypothetical protein